MVALSFESDERARLDARRLRRQSKVLRLDARRQVAASHARLAGVQAAGRRTRINCSTPVPSPWSELSWLTAGRSLDRILVPLD